MSSAAERVSQFLFLGNWNQPKMGLRLLPYLLIFQSSAAPLEKPLNMAKMKKSLVRLGLNRFLHDDDAGTKNLGFRYQSATNQETI